MFKKLLALALSATILMGMGTTTFATSTSENLYALDSDVVVVDYSNLDDISDVAKNMVDTGTLLYISNPLSSAEDVSEMLSIPKSNISSYHEELLVGYSIYKINDDYQFTNHYVVFASDDSSDEQKDFTSAPTETTAPLKSTQRSQTISNFSDAILINSQNVKTFSANTFNHNNIVEAAVGAKDDMEAFTDNIYSSIENGSKTSIPTEEATETWNDTLSVYGLNDTYYGYMNCTVYAYSLGTGTVNGETQNIYDVVSYVKAYPKSGYKVKEYTATIDCNYTDFSNLQTTDLPSGITYSDSVSLSASYGASGGSVGGGYSRSWTYNPESQVIDEHSSTPRVVSWTAETVSPTSGKSYSLIPGMRIASPTRYMRAGFAEFNCDAFILGITVNTNSIEVGGWF